MRSRNINFNLRRVINNWSKSVSDEKISKIIRNKTVVTGGCIVSMLLGEEVNDYDIYFIDKESALNVVRYYVGLFNAKHKGKKNKLGHEHRAVIIDGDFDVEGSIEDQLSKQGEKIWETAMLAPESFDENRIKAFVRSDGLAVSDEQDAVDPERQMTDLDETPDSDEKDVNKYSVKYISTNAITLTSKIQMIYRFFGDPSKIHEFYDFVHCTNYWTYEKGLVLNPDSLEMILNKELRFFGTKYPLCSIIRIRKFIKRGWSINGGEILKICLALQGFDLTDPIVLEDQLLGVDTMYFKQLIEIIRREKDGQDIGDQYLVSVIDRVFN